MIKRLKQSQVLTYLTCDGLVHFSVLKLSRKINKYSIYFKTHFVLFRENGLFDVLFLQRVTLISSQYLTNHARYENNVQSSKEASKLSFRLFQRKA